MSSLDTNFDVQKIRQDFVNLKEKVHQKPLVYFDNGATTFKPQAVIDALNNHYAHNTSNVHRGVHTLSERATSAYESSREKVRAFINAKNISEVILTSGTTDSINLVAQSFGRPFIKEGDEILISEMEHHSNIVPWQMLALDSGAILKVIPMSDSGEIEFETFKSMLSDKVKLLSIVHISNSLGTINPVKEMIKEAHKFDIPVLVDGAQSIGTFPIDVQDLDCDFFAFSAHKLCGPTGTGVLYGKERLLEKMPPYRGGGDMISSVSFKKTTYNELPYKFEAGTPNIEGVIGMGAAMDYLSQIGMENIHQYKNELLINITEKIKTIEGIKIIGTAKNKVPTISFIHEKVHAHDLGTLVDEEGVAIRTGHHCTQPVMEHFGIAATSRASLTFYNTKEEIDIFILALNKAISLF